MNAELEILARRAVACKHWRWMPGMAVVPRRDDALVEEDSGISFQASDIRITTEAFMICEPEHYFVDVSLMLNGKTRSYGSIFTKNLIPDLTDAATMGCLLAIVREAHGFPVFVQVTPDVPKIPYAQVCYRREWANGIPLHAVIKGSDGQTEAEALVAALEAAP